MSNPQEPPDHPAEPPDGASPDDDTWPSSDPASYAEADPRVLPTRGKTTQPRPDPDTA